MSVSMTKLELLSVYDPFLQVIKEPLPGVLVWALFAYIAFFLLQWFLEPRHELPAPRGKALPPRSPATHPTEHGFERVE